MLRIIPCSTSGDWVQQHGASYFEWLSHTGGVNAMEVEKSYVRVRL